MQSYRIVPASIFIVWKIAAGNYVKWINERMNEWIQECKITEAKDKKNIKKKTPKKF